MFSVAEKRPYIYEQCAFGWNTKSCTTILSYNKNLYARLGRIFGIMKPPTDFCAATHHLSILCLEGSYPICEVDVKTCHQLQMWPLAGQNEVDHLWNPLRTTLVVIQRQSFTTNNPYDIAMRIPCLFGAYLSHSLSNIEKDVAFCRFWWRFSITFVLVWVNTF